MQDINKCFKKVSRGSSRRVGYIGSIAAKGMASKTPNECYGKPNRPSTPIQGIMQNNYGNIGAEEAKERSA